MGTYRPFRNLEASIIDFLGKQLVADGWTGMRIEKNLAEVYKPNRTFPCFLVEVGRVNPIPGKEIGNYQHIQYYNITIRIFATSDGGREDLANWLFDTLEKTDIDYYEYVIQGGVVESKILTKKIVITAFTEHDKELFNTAGVALEDKYRHAISFKCKLS